MRNPFSLFSWYVLHGPLRRDVARLDRLSCEPYETIRERKMESLRRLVRRAIDNVPFYADLYRKAGVEPEDLRTFDDVKRLPCLKKEDFRKVPMEDRIARNVSRRRMRRTATSGSTGQPFSFYVDLDEKPLETAAHNLIQMQAGWRPGERSAYVKAAFDPLRGDPWRQWVKEAVGVGTIRLPIEPLMPAEAETTMDRLIACRVTLLQGYASSLCTLARQWKNRRPTPIRSVISIAETLLDSDVRLISEAFGAEVFRDYSLSECMRVGFECSRHDGLHVDPLRCIVETVQGDNDREEIVVTNLKNYVHPFIRYRPGDVGEMTFDPCPCGRRTPRIVNIGGRVLDVVRTPDGRELNIHVFGHPFREFEKAIDMWQVRQVSETEVDVLAETTEHFNDEVASRIVEMMENLAGGPMRFRIRPVDRIPLGKNGKRDRILSMERLAAMKDES